MRLTVAVLAGGESQRMGRDKAAIEVDGRTLLERVVTTALDAGFQVIVVGRARPVWWLTDGVQFIEEPIHRGPLSGLEAALQQTDCDLILVACDMPRLSTHAFEWLAEASATAGAAGLVPVNGDRAEPLFAFYRKESLPLIQRLLAEDRRAMHELLGQGEFSRMPTPVWLQAELHNVNRPEDLLSI